MASIDQHERVKQLSDSDLRQELMLAGEAVGPITSTTRHIFERKLLRCLLGDQEHTTEPQPVIAETRSMNLNGGSDADRSLNISQSSDGERVVYYGVAVPPTHPNATGRVFSTVRHISL